MHIHVVFNGFVLCVLAICISVICVLLRDLKDQSSGFSQVCVVVCRLSGCQRSKNLYYTDSFMPYALLQISLSVALLIEDTARLSLHGSGSVEI